MLDPVSITTSQLAPSIMPDMTKLSVNPRIIPVFKTVVGAFGWAGTRPVGSATSRFPDHPVLHHHRVALDNFSWFEFKSPQFQQPGTFVDHRCTFTADNTPSRKSFIDFSSRSSILIISNLSSSSWLNFPVSFLSVSGAERSSSVSRETLTRCRAAI